MLQELVVVSLATGIGWEVFRYFYPGYFPARLAPLAVVLIAFLFTLAYSPSVVLAFAAAGGVAIFHKFIDSEAPEPFTFNFRLNSKERTIPDNSGHRIPKL